MRVGHAIRKSRNAYSSSSFTGILQFTYLSSFTTKPPQIADRTMLRFMLERRLLLLKPIYRPSAFSSEICCFSTKPNQAVSFTRGDGTSQRFYKDVDIGKDQGKNSAYTVLLDGKVLKTPAGKPLILPNQRLALAVAAEWEWQPKPRDKIIGELLKYVNTDVVLCRDEPGTELAERQDQAYSHLIIWANRFFNVDLCPSCDLLNQGQSIETQGQIHNYFAGLDTWRLILVDTLIGGCRSVVIGTALLHDHLTIQEAMQMSRLEEEYQIEQWGLVEGAHDLDIADLRARLSTSKLFMKWLRL